jgi:hypothetical protein
VLAPVNIAGAAALLFLLLRHALQLGYGDVSPVTALAGTLAWMEAITGQLYLAVTVARLVALSIADSSTSRT